MRRSLAALALATGLPLSLPLSLPLPAGAGEITVKPGETLSEIADRLGISTKRLMELNGITKADHVEVGQKLKVPGQAASGSRGSGSGVVATGRVTVREGDTLSEIAARQGMTLGQLMALNGLTKADHVEVGQSLKVSGKVVSAASPAPFRKGATVHVVRSGESLSEIAEGYGVPMSRLVAINAINDPDHVEVGTQLKLKGEPPSPRPRPAEAATARPAPAPRERPVQAAASRPEPVAAAELPRTTQPVVTQAAANASGAGAATAAPWQATPAATASRPVIAASTPAATPVRSSPMTDSPISAAAAAAATTPMAAAVPAPRPSTATAIVTPRPVAPQTRTPAPAAAAPQATTVASSSWRRYGPLQVDWSNWQPMGGSLVAPILNAKGDTLYLAINCGARKMNATSVAGDWRTWDDPQADFERRLVNDLCTSRG